MNDKRIEAFDKLGDEIQKLGSCPQGVEFGELAENALKTLESIVGFLRASGAYEHGLQRVPDVQANLESARDDFQLSGFRAEALRESYRRLRMNSGAGKHRDIG